LLLNAFLYVLKAIGSSDFVGGNTPLITPFPLLIFILILYPISKKANVGTNPSVIYAADSSTSMELAGYSQTLSILNMM